MCSTGFCNPLSFDTLTEFLYTILSTAVVLLFPIIVLMIVYTGFLFVRAQGNPQKLEEARKVLLWVVIGGLIILGAQAISMAIKDTVASISSAL